MGQEMLIVINDAPYGSEKAYNALRLAIALQSRGNKVSIFLMADAVSCAVLGQETPPGYYNIGEMLTRVLAKGGRVAACGSCMKARGLSVDRMLKGVEQGSMALLSEWTENSQKIHSF
ncbi:MAG: DsrE/DsrF/TusD sulfur relay family protein [Thermoplasmata archaeon]